MTRRKRGGLPKTDRNMEICRMADQGKLLKEIGDVFNISKSRVSHIIDDYWKQYVRWRKVGEKQREKTHA